MSLDAATPKVPDEVEIALPAPGGGRAMGALRRTAEIILSFALLVGVLEGIVDVFHVETYVFPAPSAVAVALWQGLTVGHYLYGLYVTMTEVLSGFALGSLAGIVIGVAMVSVKPLERIVYPYVVGIQTIPKVAIAPLMIVWFGFGIESKVLMVALTCLFPSLVGTIAGIRGTDSDRVALIQAMRGSRLQLLRYVQLPSALPYIMAGLNTGIVLAVIGAIVGEFVGARAGIGVLILQANFALDLASVFALLVMLGVTGVILSAILRATETRLCFWSGKASK